MALVLNEEQLMLKDAARDFLSERAPVSHLRQIRDSGNEDGFSRELWAEMTEMGWAAILVPEEYGGLGYGYTGLGIVLGGQVISIKAVENSDFALMRVEKFTPSK